MIIHIPRRLAANLLCLFSPIISMILISACFEQRISHGHDSKADNIDAVINPNGSNQAYKNIQVKQYRNGYTIALAEYNQTKEDSLLRLTPLTLYVVNSEHILTSHYDICLSDWQKLDVDVFRRGDLLRIRIIDPDPFDSTYGDLYRLEDGKHLSDLRTKWEFLCIGDIYPINIVQIGGILGLLLGIFYYGWRTPPRLRYFNSEDQWTPAWLMPPHKTNRKAWKYWLFGILTVGIYMWITDAHIAGELNQKATPHDNEDTLPPFLLLPFFVMSFGLIWVWWHHYFCRRIQNELVYCGIDFRYKWWMFLSTAKRLEAMNRLNQYWQQLYQPHP